MGSEYNVMYDVLVVGECTRIAAARTRVRQDLEHKGKFRVTVTAAYLLYSSSFPSLSFSLSLSLFSLSLSLSLY